MALALVILVLVRQAPEGREWWLFPRAYDHWDHLVSGVWLTELSPLQRDKEYISEFRMSYHTFAELCDLLRPHIERKNTRFREAIPVEKRVVVALHRLAHGTSFNILSRHLGCGKSTAIKICEEVNKVLVKHLQPQYIRFPTGDKLREVISAFQSKTGLPMAAGAVDGSHIPLVPCKEHHADYINRKGWFSIVLQGCVDADCNFTDGPHQLNLHCLGEELHHRLLCHDPSLPCAPLALLFLSPSLSERAVVLTKGQGSHLESLEFASQQIHWVGLGTVQAAQVAACKVGKLG